MVVGHPTHDAFFFTAQFQSSDTLCLFHFLPHVPTSKDDNVHITKRPLSISYTQRRILCSYYRSRQCRQNGIQLPKEMVPTCKHSQCFLQTLLERIKSIFIGVPGLAPERIAPTVGLNS